MYQCFYQAYCCPLIYIMLSGAPFQHLWIALSPVPGDYDYHHIQVAVSPRARHPSLLSSGNAISWTGCFSTRSPCLRAIKLVLISPTLPYSKPAKSIIGLCMINRWEQDLLFHIYFNPLGTHQGICIPGALVTLCLVMLGGKAAVEDGI